MSKLKVTLLILFSVTFLVGCTTTGYHKKVTVEKDKDGKIIRTVVEEEISQPNLMQEPRTGKYLDE